MTASPHRTITPSADWFNRARPGRRRTSIRRPRRSSCGPRRTPAASSSKRRMRPMRERLYRSRRERVIGGLAGGLGRNLGIDVTWVRLGWVLLAFATQGAAILIYLVLLFVIPEEPEDAADAAPGTSAGYDAELAAAPRSPSDPPVADPAARPIAAESRGASLLDRFAESRRTGEGS